MLTPPVAAGRGLAGLFRALALLATGGVLVAAVLVLGAAVLMQSCRARLAHGRARLVGRDGDLPPGAGLPDPDVRALWVVHPRLRPVRRERAGMDRLGLAALPDRGLRPRAIVPPDVEAN
jgi:hypothetical protein